MIGLALSGGGFKGFAHIGALKALNELGVNPVIISGSSVGSIIGALYSKGLSINEILTEALRIDYKKLFKPTNPINALTSISGLRNVLSSELNINFNKLKTKLIVVATNLKTGKPKYFYKGRVLPAVLSSSCIPGVFKPYFYKKNWFIDGEFSDPLPVSILKNNGLKVISLRLKHLDTNNIKLNVIETVRRAMIIMREELTARSEKKSDLPIILNTSGYVGFNKKDAMKLFNIGYRTVKHYSKSIKKLLNK